MTSAVRDRNRTYSHAAGARPRSDPQVLQVVGRVHGLAYAAGAITLRAAEAVQRAYDARIGAVREEEAHAINVRAEIELAQAQSVLTGLVLDAGTILFDALGASATRSGLALDRHWRNARTIASHNPRIYKDRIVGDFAVNGTEPPFQWKIGRSPALPAARNGRVRCPRGTARSDRRRRPRSPGRRCSPAAASAPTRRRTADRSGSAPAPMPASQSSDAKQRSDAEIRPA